MSWVRHSTQTAVADRKPGDRKSAADTSVDRTPSAKALAEAMPCCLLPGTDKRTRGELRDGDAASRTGAFAVGPYLGAFDGMNTLAGTPKPDNHQPRPVPWETTPLNPASVTTNSLSHKVTSHTVVASRNSLETSWCSAAYRKTDAFEASCCRNRSNRLPTTSPASFPASCCLNRRSSHLRIPNPSSLAEPCTGSEEPSWSQGEEPTPSASCIGQQLQAAMSSLEQGLADIAPSEQAHKGRRTDPDRDPSRDCAWLASAWAFAWASAWASGRPLARAWRTPEQAAGTD